MMNRQRFFLLYVLLLAGVISGAHLLYAQGVARKWTMSDGQTAIGKWDPQRDTETDKIMIEDSKGKISSLTIASLSEEDSRYVKSRRDEIGWSPKSKPLRIFALLVGVTQYDHYQGLKYAVNDAELIRDELLKLAVPPENIILLRSGGTDEETPTKANIESALDRLIGPGGSQKDETNGDESASGTKRSEPLVREGDLLFIAFSGHGTQTSDGAYFMPSDAAENRPETDVTGSLVSIKQLQERVGQSKASFKWLFIDACRSTPPSPVTLGPESTDLPSMRLIDSPPPGMITMQSCAPTEKSWEPDGIKNGCFSKAFVTGLQGKADVNGDGNITMNELWLFISNETLRLARTEYHSQNPVLNTEQMTEFTVVESTEKNGVTIDERRRAEEFYQESVRLFDEGNCDEALEKIRDALDIMPEDEDYLRQQKLLQAWIGFTQKQNDGNGSGDANEGQTTDPFRNGPFTDGQKEKLTVDRVDYVFHWCPPGEFMMGYSGGTSAAGDDKAHRVRFSEGFWMLETEVTNKMYERVMGPREETNGPKMGVGPNFPVSNVSWKDAKAFCQRLSEITGKTIELPTEAQWEYACRAGATGDYGGSDRLSEIAWFNGNSGGTVHEVRLKKPNAWGLYDMHGNLGEWCDDFYSRDYYDHTPLTDPKGPKQGIGHVWRGGCWFNDEENSIASCRRHSDSGVRTDRIGFRLTLIPSK